MHARHSPGNFSETRWGRKIAVALDVSLDYLVGASSFVVKDKKMLHRLELLEQLHDYDRDALLKVVDNYLTTAQLHSTSKKLKKV